MASFKRLLIARADSARATAARDAGRVNYEFIAAPIRQSQLELAGRLKGSARAAEISPARRIIRRRLRFFTIGIPQDYARTELGPDDGFISRMYPFINPCGSP